MDVSLHRKKNHEEQQQPSIDTESVVCCCIALVYVCPPLSHMPLHTTSLAPPACTALLYNSRAISDQLKFQSDLKFFNYFFNGSAPSAAAADTTASQHHGFHLGDYIHLGHFGVVELNGSFN